MTSGIIWGRIVTERIKIVRSQQIDRAEMGLEDELRADIKRNHR